MPFNPQTGQWESEVLANPPAPPPQPPAYNPDPQDAMERVRLAQDLRDQGLDTQSIQPHLRPDKGINIRGRNIVKGSTMEALRPYLSLLYKQVGESDLGTQPHQRALGIAARIGVGGYLTAQKQREAGNAAEVKSAEELQAERRKYIGSRASELAKHRWEMQKATTEGANKPQRIPVTPELRARAKAAGLYIDEALTSVNPDDLTKAIPDPSLVGARNAKMERDAERLSPESRLFWAQVAAQGGDVPFYVMRGMSTEDKDAFTKDVARLSGTGYNLAKAKAVYRANAGSLSAQTKGFNSIRAFADMLDRNIGVLEPLIGQIKDTNAQWSNKPVRDIALSLGSRQQAQFNYALQNVSTEAARLLQNPGLTGVLTVEAQRDMKAVVSGNFTVDQLEGVLEIMKLDKQNRIDAYSDVMGQTVDDLGNAGGGGAADSLGVPPSGPPPPPAIPPSGGVSKGIGWLQAQAKKAVKR